MAYGPTSQLGGIRIFFFAPYSGTLISLLFRVKDFANYNSRFSWQLLPECPSLPMISWFTRRFQRYSPINSRDSMCSLPLQSPTTDKSVWIITYTFRSSIKSQWLLLLQDTSKYYPMFRESFVPAVLQRLSTPQIIPHAYRGCIHPELFTRFPKFLEILSVLSRILCSVVLFEILLTCLHYG